LRDGKIGEIDSGSVNGRWKGNEELERSALVHTIDGI
jgi:hypothetical protein